MGFGVMKLLRNGSNYLLKGRPGSITNMGNQRLGGRPGEKTNMGVINYDQRPWFPPVVKQVQPDQRLWFPSVEHGLFIKIEQRFFLLAPKDQMLALSFLKRGLSIPRFYFAMKYHGRPDGLTSMGKPAKYQWSGGRPGSVTEMGTALKDQRLFYQMIQLAKMVFGSK